MLEAGNTFSQISKEIGVSSATITRVNKCISYGADGYKIVLKRMKGEERARSKAIHTASAPAVRQGLSLPLSPISRAVKRLSVVKKLQKKTKNNPEIY